MNWFVSKWRQFRAWQAVNSAIEADLKVNPIICPICSSAMESWHPGKSPDPRVLVSSCKNKPCTHRGWWFLSHYDSERRCWGPQRHIGLFGREIK